MKKVADFIIEQLAEWGVRRIYGVTGDAIFPLMDALARQSNIEFILTRHESAAGFMASAEAKLTGKPGVCIATSGPGITNLLNGLGDAARDNVPVIAITGQVPSDKIGTGYKQYIDQQVLIQPIAGYSAQVAHPDGALSILSQAWRSALSQRTVAHISIPKDIGELLTSNTIQPYPSYLEEKSALSREQLNKAVSLIAQSNSPMMLIGIGAEHAGEQVRILAEKIHAGMILTLGAKGAVPDSHPLVLGGIGAGGSQESADLLQQADLLIMIGATWFPSPYMPAKIPVIQIDKSPSHITQEKELACAVTGDAIEVLSTLAASVDPKERGHWAQLVEEARQSHQQQILLETERAKSPISPAYLIREIQLAADKNAIITVDTGEHTVWFNRVFQAERQKILFSGTWRTMGFALPAAIAAKKVHPERQVIAVVGDGGLSMGLGELITAAANRVNLTVVVVNDHTFTMERNKMVKEGKRPFGVSLYNPDFSLVAEACGLEAYRVKESGELRKALRSALLSYRPALIDAACTMAVPESTKPKKEKSLQI